MYRYLTKLLLAGMVAVALLALGYTSMLSPAWAAKPGKLPLSCASGEVAKSDGAGGWTCEADTDTLRDLVCAAGEVARRSGSVWSCDNLNVRLAFVSTGSALGDGVASGGPASFDALCNTEAAVEGIHGTYAAWISTSSQDAMDRVKLDVNDGLIIMRNGLPVALSSADLIDGDLLNAINVSADGGGGGPRHSLDGDEC